MATAAHPPPKQGQGQGQQATGMAAVAGEEDVELGPVVGTLRLRQLDPLSFNEACKSTSSTGDSGGGGGGGGTDCTGQRVYAGCQTMVRFLGRHPWLVQGKRVVELGCGVGACGLAVAARLGAERVVLTDGQPSTLELAEANAAALGLLAPGTVSVRRLLFSADAPQEACAELLAAELQAAAGNGEASGVGVDVVLGTELMYYNVSPLAVLATAAALLRKKAGGDAGDDCGGGIILLAHIFRGAHLPQALADAAEALGLWVLSVPVEAALTEADREGAGAYWTNVSLLCCLPKGGHPDGDGDGDGDTSSMTAAAIARLHLPEGTKAFVPYADDFDAEEEGGGACLWLRGTSPRR